MLHHCYLLLQLGLLAPSDLPEVIAMEFNPVRVGFHGGKDVWTRDVLNLGVRPDLLIAKVCGWGSVVCSRGGAGGVRQGRAVCDKPMGSLACPWVLLLLA